MSFIILGLIRKPLTGTGPNYNPFQNLLLKSSLEQDPGLNTDDYLAC
ncbi:hypothetical protein OAK48_00920 [Deltaproteobacteria bacterium]|nr:hypothetical protein [Deltaproteobacteria bacterium]